MAGTIAGTLHFSINGTGYIIAGEGIEYNTAPVRKQELIDADGKISGYQEIGQPVFISGTFRDTGNLEQKAVAAIADATITAKLANGKTVSIFNAAYAMESATKSSDATMAFRFVGDEGTEILPS